MATSTDTDLMAQLEKASHPKQKGCSLGAALDALDDTTRATFVAALARPDITHTAIARTVSDRSGCDIKAGTVSRHRNRECTCD